MGNLQSQEDESGPKAVTAYGWHERRIGKLEEAFLGISTTLLPTVARLEEKIDGMHQSLSHFKADLGNFQTEVSSIKERMSDETTGNVVRDLALKEVRDDVMTKKEKRSQLWWGALKVAGAIIASVTGTILVFWLKIK
jgi:hypothetical protein